MRSSTPRGKSKGEKHDLTPSKKLVEPSTKRTNIAPPSPSISMDKQNEQKTMSSAKIVNPSGAVVKRRRSLLVNLLKETYEKCPGSAVTQDSAIDKMGLKSADCIKLTNAMKVAFPDTMNKRVQDKEGKWSIVYTNLRLKKEFIMSEDGGKKQVLFPESSEINNVKLKLCMLHSDLSKVVKEIETALTLEVINRPFIRVCIEKQRKLQEDIKTFTETLERLYEKEMSNLAKSKDPEHLCSEEISELQKEMNIFIDMLNLGLKESLDLNLDNIFNTLTSNVEEKCPLVYQIVEQLFLVKPSTLEIQKGRVKSAVHALAILVSLKSQMIKNDFKLLFSILCVSYGAGMRFINMLNHAGLSVSWDTLMNFFDSRMTKFEDYLESVAPENVPIVLLLDNINLYKGKRRHLRLFKYIAPTVWNFTGHALIIPNIDGIQHLFREKKTALESQQDPLSLEPEEVFYTSYKDKVELWQKYRDMYLLSIMDAAYNKVPKLGKDRMKDMSETDFDTWLKNANFSTVKAQFEIDVPNVKSIIKSTHLKTNVSILPLSLDDNSTIAGTATILDDWENILSLPFSSDKTTFIPFDVVLGNFDIQLARSRVEYLNSKFRHQNYMADHEAQLRSKKKLCMVKH